MIRFFAVGAPQPEMVETIVGREGDGLFTGENRGVPGAELEVSATEKVIGFGCGRAMDLLLQGLKGFIDMAGSEQMLGSLTGEGE